VHLRNGKPELALASLDRAADPRLRTSLIHQLAAFGIEPGVLVGFLKKGQFAPAVRQGLLLALGGYPSHAIRFATRSWLLSYLLAAYQLDPDAGIHGACGWLLRKLGEEEAVRRLDVKLRSRGRVRGRRWYVNGQGQTFAVVDGPVSLVVGSPLR